MSATKTETLGVVQSFCEEIAGELRPSDPFDSWMAPRVMWRCPAASRISVAALRRLERALREFAVEVGDA